MKEKSIIAEELDYEKLIRQHLENWHKTDLRYASIQSYYESGKISGSLYLEMLSMLRESVKAAMEIILLHCSENANTINTTPNRYEPIYDVDKQSILSLENDESLLQKLGLK